MLDETIFIILVFLYAIGILAIKSIITEYKKEKIKDDEYYKNKLTDKSSSRN